VCVFDEKLLLSRAVAAKGGEMSFFSFANSLQNEKLILPFPFPATTPVDDDSTFLLDAISTSNNVSIRCDNMFA
jgi:hypothetical protein